MRFRSHLMRPLDLSDTWNRSIVFLTAVAGAAGAYLTIFQGRDILLALEASGSTFLAWALCRELDPDRQAPAVAVAVLGGGWALFGMETAILPFAALLVVARILVETTGRRPLPVDLFAVALGASVVSLTPLGWVMGFGVAVAIYVDERMAEESNRLALLAALAAAVGSSVVTNLSDAFPGTMPTFRPLLISSMGLLALVAVLREPVDPVSFVDSRNKRFLRRDRLHAGRAAAGVLVFLGAIVSGETALAVVPMGLVVATALVSTELERRQRV
ncbi:MAG TPA: hypothetical protein VK990_09185 [Acidimicrobiia bacterium]|nr:hypothetical protein [Acidimicrobiia bacterium]